MNERFKLDSKGERKIIRLTGDKLWDSYPIANKGTAC